MPTGTIACSYFQFTRWQSITLFLVMVTWLCSLQEDGNVSRLALQTQVGTLQACLDEARAGQKDAEDRLASVTQQMQVCYLSVCFLSYHPFSCMLALCAGAFAYV